MKEITRLRKNAIFKLDTVIDMLSKLKEDDFDFSQYIAKFTPETHCGTVCCVIGWMPKYLPEAKLIWELDRRNTLVLRVADAVSTVDRIDVSSAFSKYLGLDTEISEALIYGNEDFLEKVTYTSDSKEIVVPQIQPTASLAEVKLHYTNMRTLLASGKFDNFLITNN